MRETLELLRPAAFLVAAFTLGACAAHSSERQSVREPSRTEPPAPPPTRKKVAGSAASTPSAARSVDSEDSEQAEPLDDSGEAVETPLAEASATRPHPLDGWSDARIAAAVKSDLSSLGSMSLGTPNAGALLNGVQAEPTPFYKPISPSGAWSTQETLDFLAVALGKVHEQFPETPPLALGDISGRRGGASPPHLSHQSGRDVDIAYFYNNGAGWYARGTAQNLDLPRNWAFVRALITETDVDLILIDHSIQALLEDYAAHHGEDPAWLSGVFHGASGSLRPIIRHAPGHATHIHVRFFNPIAQETARRCHAQLLAARLIQPAQSYITHVVKKNETLGMISRKYGVPVPRLRAANGLKSSVIRAKSKLRVPVATRGSAGPGPRLRLPPRRLSPAPPPSSGEARAAQPPPTK